MNNEKQENTNPLPALLSNHRDFLIVNLIWLFKIVLFNYWAGFHFGLGSIWSSMALIFILSCWITLLPPKLRIPLYLLLNVFISLVLFADLMFYKYYHSFITIPVLFQTGQVAGVSSSVLTLFSPKYLVFFADLLVLIPYFMKRSRRQPPLINRPLKQKMILALSIFITGVLILTFNSVRVISTNGKQAFTDIYSNNSVLSAMGLLNYHVIDFVQFTRNASPASLPANQLKVWMDIHRKQESKHLSGIAKGKNVIIIQMEALQGFVIGKSISGQEITPNLNRFLQRSMYFDNYFTQIAQGTTSDAEFMSLNSLYPLPTGAVYIMKSNNSYQSLPKMLKKESYYSGVLHSFNPDYWNRSNMYPALGFDHFYSNKEYAIDEIVGLGLSDESFFRQSIQKIKAFKQPFFSFLITLSGHHPYVIPDTKKELSVPAGEYSEIFMNYLQAQHYADKAIGQFLATLEQQGLLKSSLVVIYGDHFGSGWTHEDIQKFLGIKGEYTTYTATELIKVPMMIHLPDERETGVKHITGGQMDLYPTLANLLGLDQTKMFYFGRDLMNTTTGFATFRQYATPEGSFVTDDLMYIMNPNGVFSNGVSYDRKTGAQIGLDRVRKIYDQAKWQLKMSDTILNTNGLPKLIPME
jgi:lipoteichoic acid synthase